MKERETVYKKKVGQRFFNASISANSIKGREGKYC